MSDPRFLTVRQFAAVIGMHPTRVYEHVEKGTIPVARIGKTIRIPREVVERLARCGNARETNEKAVAEG
jgi:excisionase family DNA binding protein